MGRDLLYKPQTPTYSPEDEGTNKKAPAVGPSTDPRDVLKARARDLGGSPGEMPVVPKELPPQVTELIQQQALKAKAPAHKSAYFNKDTSSVHLANQRSSTMQALRGSEGAMDLRKIVLPPSPMGISTPEPANLRGASDLMGLDGSFDLDLGSLISRQSAWVKGGGVTAELIQLRMETLERMVADRVQALARMMKDASTSMLRSVTVAQAAETQGKATETINDLASEGGALVSNTVEQASGMHQRMAKILGIKKT